MTVIPWSECGHRNQQNILKYDLHLPDMLLIQKYYFLIHYGERAVSMKTLAHSTKEVCNLLKPISLAVKITSDSQMSKQYDSVAFSLQECSINSEYC